MRDRGLNLALKVLKRTFQFSTSFKAQNRTAIGEVKDGQF